MAERQCHPYLVACIADVAILQSIANIFDDMWHIMQRIQPPTFKLQKKKTIFFIQGNCIIKDLSQA